MILSRFLFIVFTMLSVNATAQSPNIISAHLKEAIVYKKGATLSHTVNFNLSKGNHEIIVKNIANQLDEKSIQIQAPGNVTIMSMSFTKTYSPKKTNGIELPNSELQQARRKLNQLINKRQAEEQTLNLLQNNLKVSGEQNGLNVAELAKMTTFYKTQYAASKDSIALYYEQETLQRSVIAVLEAEAGVTQSIQNEEGGFLILQVQVNNPIANTIKIDYYTPNANWDAAYDIKFTSTQKPLQISYKGNIVQTTGINWQQVKLTLSTNNPKLNMKVPEVQPWFLNYYTPVEYASNNNKDYRQEADVSAVQVIESSAGAPGAKQSTRIRGFSGLKGNNDPLIIVDGSPYMNKISDIDPNNILSMDVLKDASATSAYGSRGANGVILITTKSKGMDAHTSVVQKELNAQFEIDLPYDIASNGKEHSVVLKALQHNAQYSYVTVPRIDQDVFLVAHLSDFDKLQLLPGNANITMDQVYIGKTWINPLLVEDTIKISMGRDKRIVLNRNIVMEKSSTKLLSGNKKETYTYDIIIKNTKTEAAKIVVYENYPIATASNMEIELLESSGATHDKEKGLLTWDLNLQSNETKKIRISYVIKYPSNLTLDY